MYSFLVKLVFVFVLTQVVCAAQTNVAGGTDNHWKEKREVYKGEFPHVAQFGYKTKYGLIWHCAGALISPTKVVTTASCINTSPHGNPVRVRINNNEIEVKEWAIMSEIAVVFLKKADLATLPACLSSDIEILSATAAGWGGLLPDNQLHGTVNEKLAAVDLTTFEIFEDTIKLRSTEGSLCVADRGGPLQVRSRKSECLYDVVGALREWKECGDKDSFGEYIILSSYVKWIEEV